MAYSETIKRLIIGLCRRRSPAEVIKYIESLKSQTGFSTLCDDARSLGLPFYGVDWQELMEAVPSEKTIRKWLAHEKAGRSTRSTEPYGETPHGQKIRVLARTLAERINMPSLWDKGLWRDLPIDFQPGKYYLPIGTVDIDEQKQIQVNYYDVRTNFAEPHLIKGLFSHLSTSGLARFSELIGDIGNKGKLDNLIDQTGQYSQALLEFLKLIGDEVRGHRTKVNFHDEMRPGITGWFILTIWKDALDQAGGYPWIHESWYKLHGRIPGGSLLQLNCGGKTMGIASNEKTLKTYEQWHKKLRAKYAEHPLAKDIWTKGQELSGIVLDIRQQLQEFSDMEPLPGHCELR
jgi:hypothetical protein